MIDLSDITAVSQCKAFEYPLTPEEDTSLHLLANRLDLNLFKSFVFNEGIIKILVIDVETSTSNRDDVQLVGVLVFPEMRLFQFDHRLTRAELEELVGAADTVILAAFNYGFDLVRFFDDDAKDILLRRSPKFGEKRVSYCILKKEGVVSYALDIQRLCNNLISDKKRRLADLSEDNEFFKKQKTEDFLDRKYNAYDLMAEFELLIRSQEKARSILEKIGFKDIDIIDFILKQYRYETLESHISPIKLFEGGSRLAKALVAPYAKFPSLPAFFAGGRVCAFRVGDMKNDWVYFDINSEYPSIMSRMSPDTMKLCYGNGAVIIANEIKQSIQCSTPCEAFRKFYVDQERPTLLLSSWVLVQFSKDIILRVEALREKSKKSKKLSEHTLIYRNKRSEQTRAEGYAAFKKGSAVNLPLFFLFLQSPQDLEAIQILDASGFSISKDEGWQSVWQSRYQMRVDNPESKTALKVLLNATYGLTVDVDQPFANLMLGAHITAFSRAVSYIIEDELGGELLYTDTDSFVSTAKGAEKLEALLKMLAPFGAKREYPDADQLILFRTKRYAIRTGEDWVIKGAEKLGGREKNKILSSLRRSNREPINDIRQATKAERSKTPAILAVRKLLEGAESGEWCHYFSYPASHITPELRSMIRGPNESGNRSEIIFEETKSGEAYFACKRREPLEDLASKMLPLPPGKMSFIATNTKKSIPAETFTPLFANIDTTFLKAQISQASLLRLPMKNWEKMRLLAKTIGSMGNSDNKGVKIAVETLSVEQGELKEVSPNLKAMRRRSRKKSPFAQRRFYVRQSFPYEITYHIGQDAINNSQYKKKRFVFRHMPVWILGQMARIIDVFLNDLKLLEKRFNEVLREEIVQSGDPLLAGFYGDLSVKPVPYGRYSRFDISIDISRDDVAKYIDELEVLCKELGIDYNKGLGYIGVRGKHLTDSNNFMPADFVIYDRNIRNELHLPTFLRKYRPYVEEWMNEDVGRIEIQTHAHKSNNRRANPLAGVLNALEILRIRAPRIFDFLIDRLSVLTHMFPDPSVGSGASGPNSPNSTPHHTTPSTPIIPMLGGFLPEPRLRSGTAQGPKNQRKKRRKIA